MSAPHGITAATSLAYVTHSLSGTSARARVREVQGLGCALEVAHGRVRGNAGAQDELEAAFAEEARVVTVQAYGLHEAHALHPDPARRAAAKRHLGASLEWAARLGAPRVLTVCGFGSELCDAPFASSLAFYRSSLARARELGVRILIEPLGRNRAAAMTEPGEILGLLEELDAPDVFGIALDTGHALDDGRDPLELLAGWPGAVEELQLRGAGGAPPAPDAAIETWLACLGEPPAVVAIEHPHPIDADAAAALVARVRRELG